MEWILSKDELPSDTGQYLIQWNEQDSICELVQIKDDYRIHINGEKSSEPIDSDYFYAWQKVKNHKPAIANEKGPTYVKEAMPRDKEDHVTIFGCLIKEMAALHIKSSSQLSYIEDSMKVIHEVFEKPIGYVLNENATNIVDAIIDIKTANADLLNRLCKVNDFLKGMM